MKTSDIESFLDSWKEGVIKIGQIYIDNGDYEEAAKEFLSLHYAFDTEEVLFKPTFTKEVVFRNSIDLALSYFIKGEIAEDNGFALKPWEKIELNELNVINDEKNKIAMGTFNFKPLNEDKFTLVAFTFFFTTSDGSLKIKVHHSSPVT